MNQRRMRCNRFRREPSQGKILVILFATILFGLYFVYKEMHSDRQRFAYIVSSNSTPNSNRNSLLGALKLQASQNGAILLALVDLGAYEMTMNFYETSLLKHGITSYLFLSTSVKMCELLKAKGIACLLYGTDAAADIRSSFGTKDFVRKMNLRTYMILDALELGFDVLHTDVDMIYVRNPFLDLPCQNGSCDVAIMWDANSHNAGFLFIKNTKATIALYKDMKITAETSSKNDQLALNDALYKLKGRLNVVKLSEEKYLCGKNFYIKPGRYYGDDPSLNQTMSTAVAIHNNWIVTMEAKIYRFKEMLQWHYDENGYYSDKTAKYISYENPPLTASTDDAVWSAEKKALQNALVIGALLNRSVILPKFHCGKKFCSLINWIKISRFDAVFKKKYRENLFLTHPEVPMDIASSFSPLYFIKNRIFALDSALFHEVIQHKPSDEGNGPSLSEILQWYDNVTKSVLRFKSLYGEFKLLQNLPLGSYNTSIKAFEVAFINGNFMQFK